jgi:hypothetical protein
MNRESDFRNGPVKDSESISPSFLLLFDPFAVAERASWLFRRRDQIRAREKDASQNRLIPKQRPETSSPTIGLEIRDSIHVCRASGIFASCADARFDSDIDVIRWVCNSVVN